MTGPWRRMDQVASWKLRLEPAGAGIPARRARERAMEHSAARRAIRARNPLDAVPIPASSISIEMSFRDGPKDQTRDSGFIAARCPGMTTSNLFEAGMTETDVIIIGAGHNGLTCAAYLAMAGLRVKVVDRRKVVGGAAVTEEFHPGFRNSVAAYTVSLLNPQIISDLKLAEHGLRIVERRAQNFLPSPDGSYLLTGEGRTRQSVAKLSERDAGRIDAFTREL